MTPPPFPSPRQRHSLRWIKAFLGCLNEGRDVTLTKTYYQLKGYLI